MSGGTALRLLGGTTLAAFALCAFTPLPNALCRRETAAVAPRPAQAIVVLGSDMTRDGMLSASSLRRALEGILLYRQGMAPWLVFLGPRNAAGHSQSEARAALALECGIPSSAILTGEEMWTTRDEALGAKALLAPKGGRTILLVTGALHMGRARGLFERAGFEVIPAPLRDASCESVRPEARLGLSLSLGQEFLARAYNAAARLAGKARE
jgi:uncharacterized SAM-binding protein YcdF (DUF218 family)